MGNGTVTSTVLEDTEFLLLWLFRRINVQNSFHFLSKGGHLDLLRLRPFILSREPLHHNHINDILLHISTSHWNRLDYLRNWHQITKRNVIYVPFYLNIRLPSQPAQHRPNILNLCLHIYHRQLVRRLILVQRGKFPKGSQPCPKHRIWGWDAIGIFFVDRIVASCDTSTIGVSDDVDLFDGVVLDASNSVGENGNGVVVCEVKLAER